MHDLGFFLNVVRCYVLNVHYDGATVNNIWFTSSDKLTTDLETSV